VCLLALLLPYTPLATPLGFAPLPPAFLAGLAAMVVLYLGLVELVKRGFYRHWDTGRPAAG
jgi:Mg2+-importing ATPase